MTPSEEIINLLKATSSCMNNRWQRSALGIADSFARGSNSHVEFPVFDENSMPKNRDALATAIIAIIADLDREESYKARHEARDWLDAPFQNDPQLLKWREARAARGGIREKSE